MMFATRQQLGQPGCTPFPTYMSCPDGWYQSSPGICCPRPGTTTAYAPQQPCPPGYGRDPDTGNCRSLTSQGPTVALPPPGATPPPAASAPTIPISPTIPPPPMPGPVPPPAPAPPVYPTYPTPSYTPPATTRRWPWIVGGVALLAVAGGAALLLRKRSA